MTHKLKRSAIAALTIVLALSLPITAHAAKKAKRLTGTVTVINSAANTLTIVDGKTNSSDQVSITTGTKYLQSVNVGFSSLAVGDKIRVQSTTDLSPGTTTITSNRIEILSPMAKEKLHNGKKAVTGTISNLTPALTITGNDGTTYTITTGPKAKVFSSEPAAFTDLVEGSHVQITGQTVRSAFVASEVTIGPKRGHGKRNKALVL
jgi:hypothetical protein